MGTKSLSECSVRGWSASTEESALAKRSVKYLFSDLVLDVQL